MVKMVANIATFPRLHITEEKTTTTLESSGTKNAQILANDNFRTWWILCFHLRLKKICALLINIHIKD